MTNLDTDELVEHLQAIGLNPVVVDEKTENLDMGLSNPQVVENYDTIFIPGTFVQWAWDATSLGYAKRCPRLYKYQIIDGYRSKEENVHLRFGIEFHLSQSTYQKLIANGTGHEDALRLTVKSLMFSIRDWWPDHDYKNRINLLTAVIGYIDEHENDPAKVVILENGEPAVEQRFFIELDTNPACAPDRPYALCGYLDKIVEFNGDYFDVDYKTTKTTPGYYYWQQFEPENQMSMYTFASRVITPKPAKGVIIDVIQVLIKDQPKFVRGMTFRTEDQISEWLIDAQYWIGLAEEWAYNQYWPMNDTACDKYGGCPFRGVCSSSPQVREMILESEFEKGEQWNPLNPR
jgi:hypothetical protein